VPPGYRSPVAPGETVGMTGEERLAPPFTTAPAGTERLIGVFAPAEPLADLNAVTLVLTSVEVWTHCVQLFLAGVPSARTDELERRHEQDMDAWVRGRREGTGVDPGAEPPRDDPPQEPGAALLDLDLRLDDDAGTEYRKSVGSAGGSGTEWRLARTFHPGPPGHATRLAVTLADRAGTVVARLDLPLC
jgi:hypothetical protein